MVQDLDAPLVAEGNPEAELAVDERELEPRSRPRMIERQRLQHGGRAHRLIELTVGDRSAGELYPHIAAGHPHHPERTLRVQRDVCPPGAVQVGDVQPMPVRPDGVRELPEVPAVPEPHALREAHIQLVSRVPTQVEHHGERLGPGEPLVLHQDGELRWQQCLARVRRSRAGEESDQRQECGGGPRARGIAILAPVGEPG